jgi:hypothetical protein
MGIRAFAELTVSRTSRPLKGIDRARLKYLEQGCTLDPFTITGQLR